MNTFDNKQANSEGWTLDFVSLGGKKTPMIQKLDSHITFSDDVEAFEFVKEKAAEGSVYHQEAINIELLPEISELHS